MRHERELGETGWSAKTCELIRFEFSGAKPGGDRPKSMSMSEYVSSFRGQNQGSLGQEAPPLARFRSARVTYRCGRRPVQRQLAQRQTFERRSQGAAREDAPAEVEIRQRRAVLLLWVGGFHMQRSTDPA